MCPRCLRVFVLLAAVCLFSLSSLPVFAQDQPAAGVKPDRDSPFPALPEAAAAAAENSPGAVAGLGQWSRLAFQSFRNGNWEIYLADGDGGAPRNLSQHAGSDARPRLNLGATRVAFNSDRDGSAEIYTVNVDGTGLMRLTYNRKAADFAPSWSPDGSRIVFVSDRTGNNELWVMNADGSSPVQLTNFKDADTSPVWSPDGQWIAAKRSAGGLSTVYLIRPDGSGLAPLVTGLRYAGDLSWSPDGSQLLTDADIDGDYWNEIVRIPYSASGPLNAELVLDANQTFVDLWAGAFAPDNSAVAFTMVQYAVKGRELVLQRADILRSNLKENAISVMAGSGRDMTPSWENADLSAPTSQVEPLPPRLPAGQTLVRLAGADNGPSGISSYDVQYALAPDGPWTKLVRNLKSTETYLPDVEPGATIWLRSRATDYAGNVEAWPPVADASTQIYRWEVAARGVDNRGTAILENSLTSTPAALHSVIYGNGAYRNLYAVELTHTLSMAAQGYGAGAPVVLKLNADAQLDMFLPPAVELLQNGGFETGSSDWSGEGSLEEGTYADGAHSGSHSRLLGSDCTLRCLEGPFSTGLPTNAWTTHTTDREGNYHIVQGVVAVDSGQLRYRARSLATKQWSETEIIQIAPLPPGAHSRSVSVAVDGAGVVYLGVIIFDPEAPGRLASTLWYTEKQPGGAWTPFRQIGQELDYLSDNFSMVGDPVAGLHVLLKGHFYYRLTVQGRWTTVLDICAPELGELGDGAMTVSDNGVVHFVGCVYGTTLAYRSLSPDGVLSAPIPLGSGDVFQNGFFLAAESSGAIHGLWGPNYHYRTGDGFWAKPRIFYTEGDDTVPYEAALQMDAVGRVYILGQAWYYSQPIYIVKTADAGWSAPQQIINTRGFFSTNNYSFTRNGIAQFLASNADGSEYVLWSSPLGVSGTISSVAQAVTLPAQMVHPTLSFFHKALSGDPEGQARLSVQIDDGISSTAVFSTPASAIWTQGWVDMEPWLGKTVTVTFSTEQADGEPLLSVYLDDISLGPWTTPVISAVTPAQVYADWTGAPITVHGENFTPDSTLYLGAAQLDAITFVDEHTLGAALPAALPPGVYDLRVENADGQQGLAPSPFLVGGWRFLPVIKR